MSYRGGFRRSNLRSQYGGGGNQFSPWEGSSGSGGYGGSGGSRAGGLLPTPPEYGSQAQLAIASNLISAALANQSGSNINRTLTSLLDLSAKSTSVDPSYRRGRMPFRNDRDTMRGRGDWNFEKRRRDQPPRRRFDQGSRPRQRDMSKGHKPTRKTDASASKSPSGKSKSEDDKEATTTESSKKEDETKVEDDTSEVNISEIPKDYFLCDICNKKMWGHESFSHHIRGRNHNILMERMEEAYEMRVKLMRHAAQVREEMREIDLDKHGKRQYGKPIECAMCQVRMHGSLVAHRKSDAHLRLKKFLHPYCKLCDLEFSQRVDYDRHRLSLGHIKRRYREDQKLKITEGIDTEAFFKSNSAKDDYIHVQDLCEVAEVTEGGEPRPIPYGDVFIDLTEFDTEADIPEYNPNNKFGSSAIVEVSRRTCQICRQIFDTDAEVNEHLTQEEHYNNYVMLLKEKIQENIRIQEQVQKEKEKSEKKPVPEREGSEQKKDGGDEKNKRSLETDVTEESSGDDSGNWKRRRVASKDDTDVNGVLQDEEHDDGDEIITDQVGEVDEEEVLLAGEDEEEPADDGMEEPPLEDEGQGGEEPETK